MRATFLFVPFLAAAAVHARTIGADPVALPSSTRSAEEAPRQVPLIERESSAESRISGLSFRAPDPTRVHYTQPDDVDNAADQAQVVWARGERYKASFGAQGATYFPLFGAAMERHHPLALSPDLVRIGGEALPFADAPRAQRHGDRIELDRGAFVETYDLSAQSLEQSFTFSRLPRAGELVLSIPLDTDLDLTDGPDGLELRHALGRVTYSRAIAFDARGARCDAATHLVDGAIEIRVPASFVAGASLPLTIDPLITTFTIDATSNRFFADADMAYDPDSHTWMAIYAEDVGPENDVLAVVFGDDPSTGGTPSFVDLSTDDWQHARIASNRAAQQFLVVGAVTPPAAATVIAGRWIPAPGSSAPSLALTISGAESGTKLAPDVGGDSNPSGPTYFCVTYQLDKSSTDSDVVARRVDASGAQPQVNPIVVGTEAGKHEIEPAISSSTNGGSEWSIAWLAKQDPAPPTRVWAARVATNGTISQARAIVGSQSGSNAVSGVSVSSAVAGTRKMAITWMEAMPTFDQVLRIHVRDPDDASFNLNQPFSLETGLDVTETSVEFDGASFSIARQGQLNFGFVLCWQVFVGLPRVAGAPTTLWATAGNLVSSAMGAQHPRVATAAAAGADVSQMYRTFLAFEVRSPSSGTPTSVSIQGATMTDVIAHFTGYCAGDGGSGACPCGNNGTFGHGCANSVNPAGALLAGSGMNRLNADSFVLTVSGVPAAATCTFFQQDFVDFTAVPFGDGLRCGGTSIVRIKTKTAVGGTTQYPVGTEAPLSERGFIPPIGAQVAYQVTYRNAAAFCTPDTMNISNGIVSIWSP